MHPQKVDWKRVFKNTFTYGLALEIMAIGSGYYMYREYKNNPEFRDRVDEQFPIMKEFYGSVSGFYLSIMPKGLRDQILDEKSDESSIVKSTEKSPAQK